MVSVILAAVLWLVPLAAQATTYYTAITGNNANNGTDEATPFRTVVKCASMLVSPGDICYVKNGTYVETATVRLNTSGTAAAPIKLMAYPGHAPVIQFNDCGAACPDAQRSYFRVLAQAAAGSRYEIAYIYIEGLTVENAAGVRWYNCRSCVFRNNWIKDAYSNGLLLTGGVDNLIERNIISDAGNLNSDGLYGHAIYLTGTRYIIRNNVVYGHAHRGIQLRGNYNELDTTLFPSPEFGRTDDAVIRDNTFAYGVGSGGVVLYGTKNSNTIIENNVFYENSQTDSANDNGIRYSSCCSTGGQFTNNYFYATSPGGTAWIFSPQSAVEGVHYTQSNNVVNTTIPAFVNAPATAPASPDFRLTASAPLNIAKAAILNNNTLIVGAYKTVGTPTAAISTNKIVLNFPMSVATPIQNLSTAGVSISCPSTVCPGSPAVSSVSRVPGTDSQVEITLSGITSNACVSHADAVTVSYTSASGAWTGNDNIGPYPGLHQKILSFTNLAVTNQCDGTGPPAGSAAHITYLMEDGTGTTVSDTSGNALHGTTSGTWVSGKTGYGIHVAGGTTQQTTMPYGNLVNPSTQDMTWVVPVYIPTGTTSTTRYLFGPEIGTSQRGYIGASSGTWRVARQSTTVSAAGASNLAVVEGWNYLVARWDSTTDTVTLCNNGVTGTGGATGSYTSYTFATNFEFPLIGSNLHTTVPEATFDDVQVFTSLQDCAALYAAWNAPPPAAGGTLAQAAVQFQRVTLDTTGTPLVVGPSVQTIESPAGGGAVMLFQVHCQNISDCDATAFKLVYADSTTPTTYQQVPDSETAAGTWMWGITPGAHLNSGARSTRLTGSCTLTTGVTQVTSAQTPSVDLPQDGCIVLAYIVRVGTAAIGRTIEYRLLTEAGLEFSGGYTQIARIRVVNPVASGIGF